MKNVFKFLTILAIGSFMFASCNKDGVYTPKKKVSKVYNQSSGGDKYLSETWTWDKNLLSKIEYGSGSYVQRFEYDGKQLIKITDTYGDYWTFTYDGSKIIKSEYTEEKALSASIEYTHDGKKIISMITTYYNDSKKARQAVKYMTHVLFPEVETLIADEPAVKGVSSTVTTTFEWDGNNIAKLTHSSIYNSTVYTSTFTYSEYDSSLNPWLGYIDGEGLNLSKNNPLKGTYQSTTGTVSEFSYTYTLDGKYPTEVKEYDKSGALESTTFIEYAK